MDYQKIIELIGEKQRLTEQASLPFITKKGVCWYYFSTYGELKDNVCAINMSVRSVVLLNADDTTVIDVNQTYEFCLPADMEFADDQLYYDYFQAQIESDNSNGIEDKLFGKMEEVLPKEFVDVYKKIQEIVEK